MFYKEVRILLTTLMALIDEPSDKEKFEKLYWACRSKMYYQAYNVLNNRFLAEEAVQESLIKIAKNIKSVKYPADNSTISFIMTVTKRTAIDKARVELKVYPDSIDDEDNFVDYPDTKAIDIEKAVTEQGLEKIYNAINNLSPAYREAIILKIIHGYSNSEIAKLLKLNPKTVEMRIYRGRAILKSKLMEEEMYDIK